MRITEIYKSIQGEGRLTGTESVFVRASGCNLRCWFCDTPHASWAPEGDDLSIDDIVAQTLDFDCSHVVLTGGEPMLFAELIPLCERLTQANLHITIETAGTLDLPVHCDLMSLSPKTMGSAPPADSPNNWRQRHENTRQAPEVIRRFVRDYDYQVKFVIDDEQDCRDVESFLSSFPEIDRGQVMMMPQGVTREKLVAVTSWLEPYCRQQSLQLCPRMQFDWFDPVRGV